MPRILTMICISFVVALTPSIGSARLPAPDSIRCQLEWQTAKDRGTVSQYRYFLSICPNSDHASTARAFINLRPPPPPPPPKIVAMRYDPANQPGTWGLTEDDLCKREGNVLVFKSQLASRIAEARRAVAKGDSVAATLLASAYYVLPRQGGITEDEATRWAEAAAKVNNPRAMVLLAQLKLLRKNPDPLTAQDWLERSIKLRCGVAEYLLGRNFVFGGLIGGRNREKGLRLWDDAIAHGYAPALVARAYQSWPGDWKQLESQFAAASDAGSTQADLALADLALEGHGSHANDDAYALTKIITAQKYLAFGSDNGLVSYYVAKSDRINAQKTDILISLENSVLKNDGAGMARYGLALFYGFWGISKNVARAEDLCRSAADRQESFGYYCLGSIYESKASKDDIYWPNSVKYYEGAARLGSTYALYELGTIYAEGKPGIQSDLARAKERMTDAADLRDGRAAVWLGQRFSFARYGITTVDSVSAEGWFNYAIKIGDTDCGPANLAYLFVNGQGSRANDYKEAIRLTDITIATKGDCADYAAKLKKLAQDKLAKPATNNPVVK